MEEDPNAIERYRAAREAEHVAKADREPKAEADRQKAIDLILNVAGPIEETTRNPPESSSGNHTRQRFPPAGPCIIVCPCIRL